MVGPIMLLAVLAWELATPQARVTITPALPSAAKIINPAPPSPRGAVAILLARPLFSPLRRPASAAIQPVVQPLPPRLSGIVVTGSARYAIFVPSGGTPMIAAKGQLIGDFKIRAITTTQVILSGPNGILTLQTSSHGAASGGASNAVAMQSNVPAPIILPGGITLYPATKENLPDATSWSGTPD